jgi:phenylpropionate dioxygenase-like ring-hydroxylating dioxygenase large terminal subunit
VFIRNCWYVVAWDHEIGPDTLFARTVLGEPLLLYRKPDGGLVALEDRCCHRLAPLSAGRKEGECVRCGYHGLKFAPDGACVEAPGLDRVPPKARVRSYPVVSRNRWVFVWMGEPARADTALLPDNFSCDHPDWRHVPGYLHYDTPWLLISDNLLDFSHLSYVHENTLGGSPEIARAPAQIQPIPRGLRVSRHVRDVPSPAYHAPMRRTEGHVDRWFIYDFVLPGVLLMDSGARPVEDAPDDLSRALRFHSCQALTPETAHSTHYFFQEAHHTSFGDAGLAQAMYDGLLAAFEEDRRMITAQAARIATSPGVAILPLAMDAALLRFRRLVEATLAAERGD